MDIKPKSVLVYRGRDGRLPFDEWLRELRVDYGPGYRIYFGQKGQTLVILLCGGDKRTQERDIRQAQQYWDDYQQRESK